MTNDVYSFGFDTSLNRIQDPTLDTSLDNPVDSSVVYNTFDPTSTQNLAFGSILTGTQNSMYVVDPSKGMWLGNAQYSLAPFKVNMNGEMYASSGTFSGSITATSGTIGGFTVGADYIKDAADSMGLASTVTGGDDVRFWAGSTFASRATAPFRVTEAGAVTGSTVTITGGSVSGTPISAIPNDVNTDISLLNFTHNLVFTSASSTQINWTTGTIVMSNGRTFSISSGNTGAMAAANFIYLDTAVSTTVLQKTTTYSTAQGANKILIATAQNNTVAASVVPFGGGTPVLDGVGNIAAISITAASIAASTITGGNIATMNISGKNATFDTGSIGGFTMSATQLTATNFSVTSGAANTARVEVGSAANTAGINSGNAAGDIAFWSGATFANRATAPFRVDMAGNLTATSATLSGYVVSTIGRFGGDGSDGALSISSGTTTIDLANASIVTKNYTSISITGTGKLAFSNPATNGTTIYLKSQGAVTLTSSTIPNIDASGMGAAGGTGGPGGGASPGAGTAGTDGSTAIGIFDDNSHHGTGGGAGSGSGGDTTGGTGGAILTNINLYTRSLNALARRMLGIAPGNGGGGGGGGGKLVTAEAGATGAGGNGGNGGGALLIECAGALNFTSALGVSVAGGTGVNGVNGVATTGFKGASGGGGGGGGSGGFCLILYNTLTAASGTINCAGGAGGTGGNATGGNPGGSSDAAGGAGGAGAGGDAGAGGAGGNGKSTNGGGAGGNGSNGTNSGGRRAGGGGGGGAAVNNNEAGSTTHTGGTAGTAGASEDILTAKNVYFA